MAYYLSLVAHRVVLFFKANTEIRVLSLLIGLCLWLLVIGSRREHAIKEVPIEIRLPPGFVVSNDVPKVATFQLEGPKFFLRTLLARKEKAIVLDLSESSLPKGRESTRQQEYIQIDDFEAPAGVKVGEVVPPSLSIVVERIWTRDVPVRLELVSSSVDDAAISPSILKRIRVEPKSVRVSAAGSTLNELHFIKTEAVEVRSLLKSSVGITVALTGKGENLQLEPQRVKVFLENPRSDFERFVPSGGSSK